MEKYYPNAFAFQKTLVDVCGMRAASFSYKISDAVNEYAKLANINLSMESTPLPKEATIMSYIDQDIPVLITTTIGSDYEYHTMCAYGYRVISGETELLVYNGWHGEDYSTVDSKGNRTQNMVWIDESYASFGYYFFGIEAYCL